MKQIATTTCFVIGGNKMSQNKRQHSEESAKHLPTNIKESPTNQIKLD